MDQGKQRTSIDGLGNIVSGEASEPLARTLAVYSPVLFWLFITSVVGAAMVMF
ncbi:MAG: hypothetical protein AAF420_11890 [Pseudomonadota bacterium]